MIDKSTLTEYAAEQMARWAQVRATLGLDGEGPLTLEETIGLSHQACATAVVTAQREHGGTRAGTDPLRPFHRTIGAHSRYLPEYARHTIDAECWAPEAASTLLLHAWSHCEWPGGMGTRFWRDLFAQVPTPISDDAPEDTPKDAPRLPLTGPTRVWRAAFESEKRGMAWTTDPHVARWFAARGDMARRGRTMRVWTTTVPADRVYLVINARHESEIVADVRRLRVVEDPDHQPPPGAAGYDQGNHQWWVSCDTCGSTHYGHLGAAGVLPVRRDEHGTVTHVWLARRARGTDAAGTWGYPGGALNPGEGPWQAATREYQEETGSTLTSPPPPTVHEHTCGDWTYTTFAVEGTDPDGGDGGDGGDGEHTDGAWHPVAGLPDPLHPGAAEAVAALTGR